MGEHGEAGLPDSARDLDADRAQDATSDSSRDNASDGSSEPETSSVGGSSGAGGMSTRGGAGGLEAGGLEAGGTGINADGSAGGADGSSSVREAGTAGWDGGLDADAGWDGGPDSGASGELDAEPDAEAGVTGETAVDVEGNSYATVRIGLRLWFKENLKVTKYRDGSTIPMVASDTEWMGLTSGAFIWPADDANNKDVYGALYNGYAVADARGVCPTGWSVPSAVEWRAVADLFGGAATAGGSLRETGTAHWQAPNEGATNASGFSALPAGYRYSSAGTTYFDSFHTAAFFWTAEASSSVLPNSLPLYFDWPTAGVESNGTKCGMSVRCIKQ